MYDQAASEAAIRALGSQFDPSVMMKTRELYREPVTATEWAQQEAISNLPYGDDERQRLDLYKTDCPNAPILLFVHGGGFVAGDKASDPIFYGNVARYFAKHGYLAAAMNYRLAPRAVWPAGSEDVKSAISWLSASAERYGGDPSRIVLLGQSAGAAHIASVLFDERFGAPPAVKAAALLSGFYQACAPLVGGPALYFGEDEASWEDKSPVTHVKSGHVPLLLSLAELDPAAIAEQTLILAHALTLCDGVPPRLHWLENQNHVSSVHSLGLGTDPVGTTLREFFDRAVAT